jgi:hypothetical protein
VKKGSIVLFKIDVVFLNFNPVQCTVLTFFLVQGLPQDCFCWVAPCRAICTEVRASVFCPCRGFCTMLMVNDCMVVVLVIIFSCQEVVNCNCLLHLLA